MAPQQPASRKRIHSTGFVVLDLLVAEGKIAYHVGGTAANVAINLALLGWDATVSGLLGDDPAGRAIRTQLEAYGVDTGAIIHQPEVTTPVVIHEVNKSRHKFRFACPNCGAKYAKFRPLPPAQAATAPDADVHFFDRASAYAIAVSRSRRENSAIVFEPGSPGRPAATTSMVNLSHLFRVAGNLELPSEAAAAAAEKAQIVGLGGDGVKYRVSGVEGWHHRPSRVSDWLVDAGGAGDWLTAAVIDGLEPSWWKSDPVKFAALDEAVDRALDFAAACCRHLGTRGFVGTEEWKTLALAKRREGVAGKLPDIDAVANVEGGGCDEWFHNPGR